MPSRKASAPSDEPDATAAQPSATLSAAKRADGPQTAHATPPDQTSRSGTTDGGPSISCEVQPSSVVLEGQFVTVRAVTQGWDDARLTYDWQIPGVAVGKWVPLGGKALAESDTIRFDTTGLPEKTYQVITRVSQNAATTGSAEWSECTSFITVQPRAYARGDTIPVELRGVPGSIGVSLQRSASRETPDLPLWVIIRNSSEAMSFENYNRFMNLVLCGAGQDSISDTTSRNIDDLLTNLAKRRILPFNDTDAYRLLKVATEAFVMVSCGVAAPPFTQLDTALVQRRLGLTLDLDQLWSEYLVSVNGDADAIIPYLATIRRKLPEVELKDGYSRRVPLGDGFPDMCYGILREKLTNPCLIELLWSYWHEEGMLVQTMNAISRRFQNMRSPGSHDPLANFETDPLRPLNNLLWGYIQDEQHRLSLVRRAYEYDHHYGLALVGKAVPNLRPADSRSRFLEAFHNLLAVCSDFFDQDDNTTVIADGFPVLNALKEVHLLLSQGAHNQFGDLPTTARQEMLLQQWLLSRPEFREFLPTRIMVAYPEAWMDRVDAMKTIQGWTDTPVLHFRNLAVFGEQVLLSVRFGAWLAVNEADQAANWARFWRSAIQSYIHAYRAVTGIDLSTETTDTQQRSERYFQPSVHLQRRLETQQRALPLDGQPRLGAVQRPALAAPQPADMPKSRPDTGVVRRS